MFEKKGNAVSFMCILFSAYSFLRLSYSVNARSKRQLMKKKFGKNILRSIGNMIKYSLLVRYSFVLKGFQSDFFEDLFFVIHN